MRVYNRAGLERLWIRAGGAPHEARRMAAIALAESKGNPQAHNPSGASGLWQVMMPANAGYVPGGQANVYNPHANAVAAVRILHSQGPGAWETFTNGAYRQYMGGAAAPGAPGSSHWPAIAKAMREGKTPSQAYEAGTGEPDETPAESGLKAATGGMLSGFGAAVWPYMLDGLLVIAGLALIVYGIMVAVRPRDRALSRPRRSDLRELLRPAAAAGELVAA